MRVHELHLINQFKFEILTIYFVNIEREYIHSEIIVE